MRNRSHLAPVLAVLAFAACGVAPEEQETPLNGPDYRPRTPVTSVVTIPPDDQAPDVVPASTPAVVDVRRAAVAPRNAYRASAGPDDSVLFIDQVLPEVFLASAEGVKTVTPRQSVRGFEVKSPAALLALGDNEWLVADRTQKAKVFALGQGQLTPVRVFDAVDAYDACVLGTSLIVRGTDDGREVVHEYDVATGRHLRGFGEGFPHKYSLVRRQLSSGLVACGEGDAPIYTMSRSLPYIYAYTRDGQPAWVTHVQGFQAARQRLMTDQDGRIGLKVGGKAFDSATRLTVLDGDRLLLQFLRVRVVDETRHAVVHNVILSASTGRGAYAGTSSSYVIGGTWPHLITRDAGSGDLALQLVEGM